MTRVHPRHPLWLPVLVGALLFTGCAGRSPQVAPPAERNANALGFQPGDVEAVVVGGLPAPGREPASRRTTDRRRYAPLLEALARVTQRANPPDLLGPPVRITLKLKGGAHRNLELWHPFLVDKDNRTAYWVSDDVFKALKAAIEPLSPPPVPPPKRLTGTITVDALVRALREHGARDARDTGERLGALLFGARSGHVIELLGQKVQVYVLPSPEAAAKAAATDPADMPVDFVAKPDFVPVGNLLVTVVVPERREVARKIVAYLEMVRGDQAPSPVPQGDSAP